MSIECAGRIERLADTPCTMQTEIPDIEVVSFDICKDRSQILVLQPQDFLWVSGCSNARFQQQSGQLTVVEVSSIHLAVRLIGTTTRILRIGFKILNVASRKPQRNTTQHLDQSRHLSEIFAVAAIQMGHIVILYRADGRRE